MVRIIVQYLCVGKNLFFPQGRIMKRCKQPSLLLWLTAVVSIKALEIKAAQAGKLVGQVSNSKAFC